MRFIYIIFASALLGIVGCNNNQATSNAKTTDTTVKQPNAPTPAQSKLNAAGTQLLMAVVNKYYALKNALVATKGDMADSAAIMLSMTTDSLEVALQKDSANLAALKPFMDTVISHSMMVSAIKDESCERQRLLFGAISSAMFGLLKNAGLKNAGVYREYCPMAFNEKGAYWLSDDTEIKNPYFGKKMMECGEVTDTL
jgi:hypothetical protein